MQKEVIDSLPEVLREHICTLKKASTDTTNKKPMSQSRIKVINFDKIPAEYARGKGWSNVPRSNDALYIDSDNKWFFIEFKNGSIKLGDVYRKIYDSIIMLIELKILPDYEFIRQNIQYILVYNSAKYGKLVHSDNRNTTYNYIMERAQMEERLFDIDKLQDFLFKETHTYTKEQFEQKFVLLMEKQEEKAATS